MSRLLSILSKHVPSSRGEFEGGAGTIGAAVLGRAEQIAFTIEDDAKGSIAVRADELVQQRKLPKPVSLTRHLEDLAA